jgi:glycosyltransferase involved in cell wall biosynthesis
MSRTRVAVVVTRFTAGAGGVALRGAVGLDPTRWDVRILYGAGDALASQAEQAGLEVHRLAHMRHDVAPRDDLAGVREVAGLLEEHDIELVHTHSAKAGAIGRFAARRVGIPAVHTLHGFPFHDFQSPLVRQVYVRAERRLGRITDQFMAVGSQVAADAIRLGIAQPDRIRVVASAIDLDGPRRTPATRHRARLLLGLPEDAEVVGTVGRLDFQKAPEHFLEAVAASRRPALHAVWVGDGPLLDRTAARARRLGIADRVHLLGQRDDVAALLPGFDVFAMSSRYEGMPCALAEAMVCGIPAAATAVNSVPEMIVPGRTGLLARAGEPASLARAVDHLLDHPLAAQRMAEEARELVTRSWSTSDLASAVGDAYEAALGTGPATAPLPRQPQPAVPGSAQVQQGGAG